MRLRKLVACLSSTAYSMHGWMLAIPIRNFSSYYLRLLAGTFLLSDLSLVLLRAVPVLRGTVVAGLNRLGGVNGKGAVSG